MSSGVGLRIEGSAEKVIVPMTTKRFAEILWEQVETDRRKQLHLAVKLFVGNQSVACHLHVA